MQVKFYLRPQFARDGKVHLPETLPFMDLYVAYFDENGERVADVDVCLNYAGNNQRYIREDAEGIFPFISTTYRPTVFGFVTAEDFARLIPICSGKLRAILRRGGYTCSTTALRERVQDKISRAIANHAAD